MLCTVASATGLRDAESIIINRGRSVASWTFTGRVFHPAQRPVERAPAQSFIIERPARSLIQFLLARYMTYGTTVPGTLIYRVVPIGVWQ